MVKRVLKWVGIAVALVVLGAAGFVGYNVMAFNSSVSKVYDVPLPTVERSTAPEVLERGKHLAESIAGCTSCHGPTFAGGRVEPLGPLGKITIPNVTAGGRIASYSDPQLARLIKHGIKKDGTTVRFMPMHDIAWFPESDVNALVSYVRSLPSVAGDPGLMELSPMIKVLDRFNAIPVDIARRIPHANMPEAPPPSPDAKYGSFVGTSCHGCHGEQLSGGPIPGAPPDLPVPLNLTPHETGLKGYTYEDFMKVVREGKRRDGRPLAEFMPVQEIRNMNETETHALFAYLQSVPPRPFGGR